MSEVFQPCTGVRSRTALALRARGLPRSDKAPALDENGLQQLCLWASRSTTSSYCGSTPLAGGIRLLMASKSAAPGSTMQWPKSPSQWRRVADARSRSGAALDSGQSPCPDDGWRPRRRGVLARVVAEHGPALGHMAGGSRPQRGDATGHALRYMSHSQSGMLVRLFCGNPGHRGPHGGIHLIRSPFKIQRIVDSYERLRPCGPGRGMLQRQGMFTLVWVLQGFSRPVRVIGVACWPVSLLIGRYRPPGGPSGCAKARAVRHFG